MKFGRIGICVYLNKGINFGTNGISSINFVSKLFCTVDHWYQHFIYYIISSLFIYKENYINKPWPPAYIT